MIKASGRLILLLLVCLLFVYAPEILTAVSAPYSLETPKRVLLRVALCCEDEPIVSSLYKTINAYQKEYSTVHLRITRVSEDQLLAMRAPYPDVFLVPHELAAYLHADAVSQESMPLLCAVSRESKVRETADNFAIYLYEATSLQNAPADF